MIAALTGSLPELIIVGDLVAARVVADALVRLLEERGDAEGNDAILDVADRPTRIGGPLPSNHEVTSTRDVPSPQEDP